MNNIKEIEKVLRIIKSKIEAHNEFKRAYNKQLAFDFNMLNFFSVGENKVSEILAFFLNEKKSHGQGDIFLKEFLKILNREDLDTSGAEIKCEKVITNERRIDVYIKLKETIIAIENKLEAVDQKNQLKDYSDFLRRKTGGKYLLLYLNKKGADPNVNSIGEKEREKLIVSENLKIIGYRKDIFPLLDKWISICQADNVSYFIKQFKQYLDVELFGNKTLKMTENLKKLILSNKKEVQELIKAYNEIENSVHKRLKKITQEISNSNYTIEGDIKLEKKWVSYPSEKRKRVYKFGLSKGQNKIWIQIVQDGLDIYINHYWQNTCDSLFISIVEGFQFDKKEMKTDLSNELIVEEFKEQIKKANEVFQKHDKKS